MRQPRFRDQFGAGQHLAKQLAPCDPTRIVVAVPVAAAETRGEFRDEVDDIVCAITPEPFYAVGLW